MSGPVPGWGKMPSDEEIRARIKAYAAATGVTMAKFAKGWRRLTEVMNGTAVSMRRLQERGEEENR